jgi:hypothetical protein
MTCGAIPGRLQLLTYSAVLAPRAIAIFKSLAAENSDKIKFARRLLLSTHASRRMQADACGETSKARTHRKASHRPMLEHNTNIVKKMLNAMSLNSGAQPACGRQ